MYVCNVVGQSYATATVAMSISNLEPIDLSKPPTETVLPVLSITRQLDPKAHVSACESSSILACWCCLSFFLCFFSPSVAAIFLRGAEARLHFLRLAAALASFLALFLTRFSALFSALAASLAFLSLAAFFPSAAFLWDLTSLILRWVM